MITTFEEYYNSLIQVKDTNKPQIAVLLPKTESIYSIDLDTKKIEAPEYLGVKNDHYAETIYFKVDRYFDNMDLATTMCLIQYVNEGVKKETGEEDQGHYYLVPFYDIVTLKDEKKILIPWMIGDAVTAAAGNVRFSFRFFLFNANNEYIYCLNTVTAISKIRQNMEIADKDNENLSLPTDEVTLMKNRINELSLMVGTYWIDATKPGINNSLVSNEVQDEQIKNIID